MVIGILQIELFIAGSRSLKEKRMALKSLKTRLRNNFNVAISELNHHDKWQRALLGIASINNSNKDTDRMFSHIINYIGRERALEIIDHTREIL